MACHIGKMPNVLVPTLRTDYTTLQSFTSAKDWANECYYDLGLQGTLKGRILLHAELPADVEAATAHHLGWSIPKPKTRRKKIRSIAQQVDMVFF